MRARKCSIMRDLTYCRIVGGAAKFQGGAVLEMSDAAAALRARNLRAMQATSPGRVLATVRDDAEIFFRRGDVIGVRAASVVLMVGGAVVERLTDLENLRKGR